MSSFLKVHIIDMETFSVRRYLFCILDGVSCVSAFVTVRDKVFQHGKVLKTEGFVASWSHDKLHFSERLLRE